VLSQQPVPLALPPELALVLEPELRAPRQPEPPEQSPQLAGS
jgi:hypothetical protein